MNKLPLIAVLTVMISIAGITTYNFIQNIQLCEDAREQKKVLEQEMLKDGGIPLLSYQIRGGLFHC